MLRIRTTKEGHGDLRWYAHTKLHSTKNVRALHKCLLA